MGKVIMLGKRGCADDFTELLRRARKDADSLSENDGVVVAPGVEDFVRKRLNNSLLTERQLLPDLFRCALYVSEVVGRFVGVPDSYYAFDYLERSRKSGNPKELLNGADMCCVVCIFFPGWANRRCMRLSDYEQMGVQLYSSFYEETGREIAWHMAGNFRRITEIGRRCFSSF